MKVQLNKSSNGKSFSLVLTSDNEEERIDLIELTQMRYTLSFAGYQYMDPTFRFFGHVPSND
jgi:hypothetical protein